MGIYVKGMEMPKNCNECPLCFYEGQAICCCRALPAIEDGEILKPWKNKRKDCPLVEIEVPHGRLIDAVALRTRMYHEAFETDSDMQRWESGCWIRYRLFERTEEAAPTIIEAEQEG